MVSRSIQNGEMIHVLLSEIWTPKKILGFQSHVLETIVDGCYYLLVTSVIVEHVLVDTADFPPTNASHVKINRLSTIGCTLHLWLLYPFSITGIISSKLNLYG